MSNRSRRVAVIGAGSAGVAAMQVAALEHDIELVELDEVEPRREIALVAGPRPLDFDALACCEAGVRRERGGKQGSADWKQHNQRSRRGKFKRRNR